MEIGRVVRNAVVVRRLVVRENLRQILAERLKFGGEAAGSHLKHHQQPGDQVVSVHEKAGRPQMVARLLAHPPNDLHPAIDVVNADMLLTPEVVIQMHFVPGLAQTFDAIGDGFDPHRLRVLGQENLGASRVVIQEQQAPGDWLRLPWKNPFSQARKPASGRPDRPCLVQ